ncbi:MAG: Ribosome maturation factor RimM [Candidatus Izimaplasma bacterium HR2]|nr:MAG: Ribosome maturation factor RimM [Candidatus Izimaplasma bacterium HR2]
MEYVSIGKIVNTHGLKGNLKVKSFTDFKKDRYKLGNLLYIAFKGEYIPVTVSMFKTVKNLDHIAFKEYDDINMVEKYKGSHLMFNKEEVHNLDTDEFYFNELIGLDVYTDDLSIGKCTDIREYPQGEILVIKRDNKKDALIPFRKEFVKEVDKELKRIYLINWEGLL